MDREQSWRVIERERLGLAARAGATRVWTMGWPFWARRRLAGFRLSATDVEWTVGSGAVGLPRLDGDGVPEVTARLAASG